MVDVRPDPKPVTEGGIGRKKPDRGNRRRGRVTASRDEWLRLREAKLGPCRLWAASVTSYCGCGVRDVHPHRAEYAELHHLVPRSLQGDDVADNLVPLCPQHHGQVTRREHHESRLLAARLTDAEYAYIIGKLGEGALERLFGVVAAVERTQE